MKSISVPSGIEVESGNRPPGIRLRQIQDGRGHPGGTVGDRSDRQSVIEIGIQVVAGHRDVDWVSVFDRIGGIEGLRSARRWCH